MKTIKLLILTLFISFSNIAQITAIPDTQFETVLIDLGIDSDGIVNGQVLTSDIDTVIILDIVHESIQDLTGLEDFAALEILDVSLNPLTVLDVSNNIQLKELYVSNSGTFDLWISSLDLSNNINLELLSSHNIISLESLNLKNDNNSILTVWIGCEYEGEPCVLDLLNCITVDDASAATNNEPPYSDWTIGQVDFVYSEDCSLGFPNPQLIDNTWYFSNGELNGEAIELPYSNFSNELNFYLDSFALAYPSCEEYTSGNLNYGIDTFDLVGGTATLVGFCSEEFLYKHYSVYYDENDIPKNTFDYSIENDGSNLMLTVNNGNGDFAVYNNYILANSGFSLDSFKLYPNPVKDILQIESQNFTIIKNIKIYDVLGKLVIESKGDTNQLDVSRLAKGLFFVKVETNKGVVVRKIIKG